MHNVGTLTKLVAGGLLSAGLTVGMFVTAGAPVAQADAWPGCPNDHPAGPCHWCPGDPPARPGAMSRRLGAISTTPLRTPTAA